MPGDGRRTGGMVRGLGLAMVAALVVAPGCKRDRPETGPTLDTGWFTDSGTGDPDTCPHRIVDTSPEAEDAGWYWREHPRVWTSSERHQAYDIRLLDASGTEVPTTLAWSDDGLVAEVRFEGGLAPSASYRLALHDCAGDREVAFSTSAYGTPLIEGPESLIGRTYVTYFTEATWEEPPGFGVILSIYFTAPVLVGVEWADDAMLDLLGAQGKENDAGDIRQLRNKPTWDFPAADFTEAPFFSVDGEVVELAIEGVLVPIHSFHLEGTFSADGTDFGGGVIAGLGDTRDMGDLLDDPGNPAAVCELAGSMGVACTDCPDGEPWCLQLIATGVDAHLVEGLTLVRRE